MQHPCVVINGVDPKARHGQGCSTLWERFIARVSAVGRNVGEWLDRNWGEGVSLAGLSGAGISRQVARQEWSYPMAQRNTMSTSIKHRFFEWTILSGLRACDYHCSWDTNLAKNGWGAEIVHLWWADWRHVCRLNIICPHFHSATCEGDHSWVSGLIWVT